jgi:hypothetical protein
MQRPSCLEFHLEPRALDVRERHPVDFPSFFEKYQAFVHTGEPSCEGGLPVDRLGGHELGHPALEPPVVRLVPERAIQPR